MAKQNPNIVSRRKMLRGLGAAGVAGLAGCTGSDGGDGGDGGGGGGTPTPEVKTVVKEKKETVVKTKIAGGEGETLKIGSLLPLTGPFAGSGEDARAAIKMAARDFLAGRGELDGSPSYVPEGGSDVIGDVEFFFRDTKLDPEIASRKYRQLLDQTEADAVVGGISSSVTIGLADIAESRKELLMLTGTGNTTVTGTKRGRYHFRTYQNAHTTANTLAKYLVNERGLKNWFVTFSDYAWGHDIRDFTRDVVEANGGEIVGTAPAPLGASDFSSQISKASTSGADFAYFGVFGADAINSLKQTSEFGLKSKMEVGIPIHTVPQSRGLTQQAMAGVWGTLKGYFLIRNENNDNFTNRFNTRYGRVPSSEATTAYKGMMEVLKAVDRAGGKDTEAVIDELERPAEETNLRTKYFKDYEEYFRTCDHQLMQPDHIGRGFAEKKSVPEGLPSVDFPLIEVISRLTPEDGIFRACDELPDSEYSMS